MKIALVVNAFPKASETFIYGHVKGLSEQGYSVTVITHAPGKDATFFPVLEQVMIQKAATFEKNWPARTFYLLLNWRVFLRNCVKIYPLQPNLQKAFILAFKLIPFTRTTFDLVLFEFSGLAVNYLDVLPFIRAKKIVSCRGSAEKIRPLVDKGRQESLQALGEKVELFHCVTQNMGATMIGYGIPAQKIFVNYPSIDTTKFTAQNRPLPSNQPVQIVSVGRINWVKGYPDALVAMRTLLDQGYDLQYTIIGPNDAKEQMAFMIQALSLQDHVFLPGAMDSNQIVDTLSKADIFLLPSISEGLSNAALEAMSMELPVVSTLAGGMNEVIKDGENGLLVGLFSPEQISQRIAFLIENPTEARKLGQNARKTVLDKFQIQHQIRVFSEVYQQLTTSSNWD